MIASESDISNARIIPRGSGFLAPTSSGQIRKGVLNADSLFYTIPSAKRLGLLVIIPNLICLLLSLFKLY